MSAINKLSWSASASFVGAFLDVAKLIILARYIEPQYFAEFAVALVVVGFCQLLSEGGIGNAVVSKENISPQQAGAVFNLSFVVSVLMYLVVLLLTPLIASFYSSQALESILPFIILVIPFSALASILQAMLRRELNMQAIAKATLLGKLASLICAWWLCVSDFGIWSLVWSTILGAGLTFILLFAEGRRLIAFSLSIRWAYIQPILSFSIYQLGELTLNFFTKNFDVLLLTKLMGAEVAGLYVVCKNLLARIGDIIVVTFSRYFHPLMAKVQHERAKIEDHYLSFFRSVSLCVLLAYVLVAVNHELIISVLLGDLYFAANELFALMAFWLSLRYCTAPVATLWLVRQKPQIGLYWNILVAMLVPLAVYISHSKGLYNVLIWLTLVQVFFLFLSIITTYWLTWKSKKLTYALLMWLLSGIALVAPFYWLIEIQSLATIYTLLGSISVFSVVLFLVWKYRTIFIGSEV